MRVGRSLLLAICAVLSFLFVLFLPKTHILAGDEAPIPGMPEDPSNVVVVVVQTSTPTPFPTPQDTPAPWQTPTPAPNACEYYQVEFQEDYNQQGEKIVAGAGQDLPCVDRIINEAFDWFMANTEWNLPEGFDLDSYLDLRTRAWRTDDIATLFPDIPDDEEVRRFIGSADDMIASYFARHLAGMSLEEFLSKKHDTSWYDNDTFFMDANCEPTTEEEARNLCGELNITWIYTPISLLWDDDEVFGSGVGIVKFPLDPAQTELWYSWKASASAPLLVFDPGKSGTISSGAQLFGNYSFNGKRENSSGFAPVSLTSERLKPSEPWRDGYEALQTLDLNGDGRLSDSELDDLALWFDNDRDGRPQIGEVKGLEEFSISAIYTKPDRIDESTGDIFASVGYDRIIDGRTVTKASVDWMSHSGSSRFEVMTRLQQQETRSDGHSKASPSLQKEPEGASRISPALAKQLSGMWRWKLDEQTEMKLIPTGVLTFLAHDDGKIAGHSYVEVPFKPNNNNLKSTVGLFRLKGTATELKDGRLELQFTVTHDGQETKSKATLSPDGNRMEGTSTLTLKSGSSFTYRWKGYSYFPRGGLKRGNEA